MNVPVGSGVGFRLLRTLALEFHQKAIGKATFGANDIPRSSTGICHRTTHDGREKNYAMNQWTTDVMSTGIRPRKAQLGWERVHGEKEREVERATGNRNHILGRNMPEGSGKKNLAGTSKTENEKASM